jgi:hypothetical protein
MMLMTAIQSRPQLLSWPASYNRLHPQPARNAGNRTQSQASNPFFAPRNPQALTQDTVRFAGRMYHRVADNSTMLSDSMQLQYADPPLEKHDKIDARKLELAHELSDWMTTTLDKKQAIAAVVARNGNAQAQRHDPTGMAHSGLALFDSDKKEWMIYNLLNDVPGNSTPARLLDYISTLRSMPPKKMVQTLWDRAINTSPRKITIAAWSFTKSFSPNQALDTWREVTRKVNPRAQVWRSEPLEFFYEQPVAKKDALVMIPPADVQARLRDGILSGRYKKLYFTPNYNLVSQPHTSTSLNCNKWVLMNVMAAKQEDYTHTTILKVIEQCFKPGRIMMSPFLRPFAKIHPTILGSEVPVYGPINTVTVDSLYHSGLFPDKEFCAPRAIKDKAPSPAAEVCTAAP